MTHLNIKTNFSRTTYRLAAAILALLNISYLLLTQTVNAENQNYAYLRLDRMATSQTTGGTVSVTTGATGSQTEADVQVTFPGSGTQGASSFGVNATAANWTTNVLNLPAGCTAWPSIQSQATSVSGATVTWTSGNLAASTTYCFNFSGTSTLSNPTSANPNLTGTIVTRETGPTVIDTTNYATAIVTNDQISVTATVPPIFSFSLSGNTDALGTLSNSSVTSSPTPRTLTIGTNAGNGFIAWVKDANAGLTSPTASDTINTSGSVDNACSAAYSAGTEFYGLDADETTDPQTNGAIDAEYNCSATTVGAFSTSFTELASSSGPSEGYVLTLNNRAASSTINKAATDYADTITVTGAGQF